LAGECRELGRRRRQVRRQHVRVGRVEHGGLERMVQQDGRMVQQIGVQRVIAGDEHRYRVAAGPPGSPGLLP